jgi:NAD(P)-dependent dehydrogenase (short-subunit alcohol dehydrogenase family)
VPDLWLETSNSFRLICRKLVSKVFIVTGATSGIGRATALRLAQFDATLLLVGRNSVRGSAVAELINKAPKGRAHFFQADLSVQASVRSLATSIQRDFHHVDAIINNAGARFDTHGETPDGLERTFATNHLGHFLLTCLFLESQQPGAVRVITVSSSAHCGARPTGQWLISKNHYDRKQAYALSKLANILFAFELARLMRDTEVVSNAVDPGVVATNFARNNGLLAWAKHIISHFLRAELVSPNSAADTIAYLALAPEMGKVSGRLFRCRRETQPSKEAEDRSLASGLWTESMRLTGLAAINPSKYHLARN